MTDETEAGTGALAVSRGESLALPAVLLLALGLRLWGLEANGWGAEYFTAAVRSMALTWRNFFFAAFDPAGFISVDKPPLALWLQVAAVKLLGFKPLSLFLPQVLMGTASVWVIHRLVRPRFGPLPAFLAALFLALTPIWVAANRTNNTDTCLVLVLLLAAWALLRATEEGRRGRLLLSMALVGLAFQAKMLAAYVGLPAFFLVYLVGAPLPWPRRVLDLALAALVVVAASLPWLLAVDLTPPENRPFVGSSRSNSAAELVVGFNAMGRFVTRIKPPATPPAPTGSGGESERAGIRRLEKRIFVTSPPGPLRLVRGLLAAQVAWLFPLAIMAFLGRGLFPRPGGREPFAGTHLLFWALWTAIYAAVYSAMGGIIHYYYLATLAPALAVLAGIGLSGLWRVFNRGGWGAVLLPAALLITAAWQFHLQADALAGPAGIAAGPRPEWLRWLHLGVGGGCLAAGLGLVLVSLRRRLGSFSPWPARGFLGLGVSALLALPTAWALSSVILPAPGLFPSADLYRLVIGPRYLQFHARYLQAKEARTAGLAAFLQAHNQGERYLLSTSTTLLAAPLIIRTGSPVMARGGFHGLDRTVDPASLSRLVRSGEVRFVMIDEFNRVSRRMGAERAEKPLADWVRAHGRPVDSSLWSPGGSRAAGVLYDLEPEKEGPPDDQSGSG